VKIRNYTHWRTDQIRPLLQRCAEMELDPPKRKRLVVEIKYSRRSRSADWCGGLGTYGGRWSQITVPSVAFNVYQFVLTACHEFAHNRGMHHRQMPGYYMNFSGDVHPRYAWAKDPALVVERKVKAVTPKAVLVERRHEHAVTMLRKADTRLKRAQTFRKKWATKVRRYERQAAARPGVLPERATDGPD